MNEYSIDGRKKKCTGHTLGDHILGGWDRLLVHWSSTNMVNPNKGVHKNIRNNKIMKK
jgi:hypothetical protein